jgi:uncharacterized phage protein gp47/JayE
MSLDLPETAAEISTRAKVDIRRELEQSDPFLRRSYLGAIVSSICNRVFEFYQALRESELESNPLTAVRNLLRFASAYGFSQLPGAPAAGQIFIDASGGVGFGTLIPIGTRFVSSNGSIYVSSADGTLASGSKSISALTSSGTTATATTTSAHGLASNAVVSISGANEADYNLSNVAINVISATQFTYELAAAAASPATGTIIVSFAGATIGVSSEEAGDEFNLEGDAELAFETPILGVNNPSFVVFPGVIDGTDLETREELRVRLIDRIQNPVTNFNSAQIRSTLLGIAGVTRVFVQDETPAVGQVTVYFMRDNDDSPIPDAGEVAIALAALIEIKPAPTADADVIVSAPTEQSTNFIFTALSPDTATMRSAIATQLADFFAKRPDVGLAVQEDAYRSAIFNTIDPANGQRVTSFTLSTPVGNLSAAAGEIRTLGTVTFP